MPRHPRYDDSLVEEQRRTSAIDLLNTDKPLHVTGKGGRSLAPPYLSVLKLLHPDHGPKRAAILIKLMDRGAIISQRTSARSVGKPPRVRISIPTPTIIHFITEFLQDPHLPRGVGVRRTPLNFLRETDIYLLCRVLLASPTHAKLARRIIDFLHVKFNGPINWSCQLGIDQYAPLHLQTTSAIVFPIPEDNWLKPYVGREFFKSPPPNDIIQKPKTLVEFIDPTNDIAHAKKLKQRATKKLRGG